MVPKTASNSDRFAILTRVQALTHEDALSAMMAKAKALGYEPICASCRPTHLPRMWEGAVEIKESK